MSAILIITAKLGIAESNELITYSSAFCLVLVGILLRNENVLAGPRSHIEVRGL